MNAAYLAGLFDGEGYITINRQRFGHHVRYQLFVGINMTDPRAIRPIHRQFGGNFYLQRRHHAHWRTLFCWVAASQQCEAFLAAVLPYLKVKREEALVALRLRKHFHDCPRFPGVKGHHPRVMRFRERCYQRMKVLKHRTFP